MDYDMTQLERAVLQKLLQGEHPVLQVLRSQAKTVRVVDRTYTGAGFNTRLQIREDAPRVETPRDFHLGDVDAEVDGLNHGAGFVLFVADGELDRLEGYSYEEPWPDAVEDFDLRYRKLPREFDLTA